MLFKVRGLYYHGKIFDGSCATLNHYLRGCNTDAVFLSRLFTQCLAAAIWLCSQALFIFTRRLFTRSLIDVLQSPGLSGLSVTSCSAPRCIIKNVDKTKRMLVWIAIIVKKKPFVTYFSGIKTFFFCFSNAMNWREAAT